MKVQLISEADGWVSSGGWGFRLTSDTDAKLQPLKIGDSVSFKAGGRAWKTAFAKATDILTTSIEPQDMTYTMVENGAIALVLAGSTIYAVSTQLF